MHYTPIDVIIPNGIVCYSCNLQPLKGKYSVIPYTGLQKPLSLNLVEKGHYNNLYLHPGMNKCLNIPTQKIK